MTPPLYFLAALVSIVPIAVVAPVGVLSVPLFDVAGIALILAGVWLNIRGSGQFERAGTPIRPGSRGGSLVTDGVFRFSRNPMYLGLAAGLVGAALGLGSVLALAVPAVFVWILDRRFIAKEEQLLDVEFGEAYREYQRCVRRWI